MYVYYTKICNHENKSMQKLISLRKLHLLLQACGYSIPRYFEILLVNFPEDSFIIKPKFFKSLVMQMISSFPLIFGKSRGICKDNAKILFTYMLSKIVMEKKLQEMLKFVNQCSHSFMVFLRSAFRIVFSRFSQ